MQGLRRCSNDVIHLDLGPVTTATSGGGGGGAVTSSSLSIDDEESAEARIQRLISEHPVIIFSRSSCCMCHVMKKLLATIGVHPTVIELDDHEIPFLPSPPSAHDSTSSDHCPSTSATTYNSAITAAPAVFIGGTCVGGLESLVALHLSGHLIPRLVEVGAL
ncbi:Glutaredoxin [Parasponia andersonii]|uniref:Glutaredoxin n=1 Tax=Parasponia andersonii TaxID=3476 RepID=A0A2P5C5K7_PARAD|nr:Glutaredoxin [Parasponia andersonii]